MQTEAVKKFVEDYEEAQFRLGEAQEMKVLWSVNSSFFVADHSPVVTLDEKLGTVNIVAGYEGSSIVDVKKLVSIAYKVVDKK
ncbi:MAG: hypothetical protein J6Y23_04985 [Prevotella sp.]|nr:hypothetical protein [Prevotella sp.]